MSNVSSEAACLKLFFFHKICLQREKGAGMPYQCILSQEGTECQILSIAV